MTAPKRRPPVPEPPRRPESAFRPERISTILLLVVLPLAAWWWIVVLARDMYGSMTGASAWMMTMTWDAGHVALLWTMWAVMMAGMMLPSASPLLLVFSGMARRSARGATTAHVYALAAGYLMAWFAFSLGATALQRVLATMVVMSPMMVLTSPVAGGVVLLIAGIYQLTPFKHACLRRCRSPFGFLMEHWRSGAGGAFRLGLEHGASCVGCCWALMLLLFVGGVMNLAVIAALTAFVAFEKLSSLGERGARVSGVLLVAAAIWMWMR